MKEFIGYTVALECNGFGQFAKLIAIEFNKVDGDKVMLEAVSGRNLAPAGVRKTITQDEYDDRPLDPYNKVKEARWAMNLLGYTISAEEH